MNVGPASGTYDALNRYLNRVYSSGRSTHAVAFAANRLVLALVQVERTTLASLPYTITSQQALIQWNAMEQNEVASNQDQETNGAQQANQQKRHPVAIASSSSEPSTCVPASC